MRGSKKVKIGTTEIIANTLKPQWIQSIDVTDCRKYNDFIVEMYDADDPNKMDDLTSHGLIGSCEF